MDTIADDINLRCTQINSISCDWNLLQPQRSIFLSVSAHIVFTSLGNQTTKNVYLMVP